MEVLWTNPSLWDSYRSDLPSVYGEYRLKIEGKSEIDKKKSKGWENQISKSK